jgi:XTP/dITP diphosphohydrolase
MTKILIATTNLGKRDEFRAMLDGLPIELLVPADIGLAAFDVDETGDTFIANALLKAQAYSQVSGLPTLADDSGLVVDALGGDPGVRSARYAPTVNERNDKVLTLLRDVPLEQRTAHFACVIVVALSGGLTLMGEGAVHGRIGFAPRGTFGHGYDPIFDPIFDSDSELAALNGKSLAELPMDVKNQISHRARALNAVLPALRCVLNLPSA